VVSVAGGSAAGSARARNDNRGGDSDIDTAGTACATSDPGCTGATIA
jgi:hypothetical protein